MKHIFTYGGAPATRTLTVAGKIENKRAGVKMTQVTAGTRAEAEAAAAAGIDLIITLGETYDEVRAGAPNAFITVALMAHKYVTQNDILAQAINYASNGADSILTPRSFETVQMIAREGICVQGHLGMVPNLATKYGGLRLFGKTAEEACMLMDDVRRLEDAGAYGCEIECVASDALAEISKRSPLVLSSIGSGPNGDVIFLFMPDVCGETEKPPRHAKAWGDVASLQQQIQRERVRALKGFQQEVREKSFPDAKHSPTMSAGQLDLLISRLGPDDA